MKPTKIDIIRKEDDLNSRITTSSTDDKIDLCEWYHQECLAHQYDDIEWPDDDDAVGIVTVFTILSKSNFGKGWLINYIERPKKKMEPEDGKLYFVNWADAVTVAEYNIKELSFTTADGRIFHMGNNKNIKLFNKDYFGKRWEDIPNE